MFASQHLPLLAGLALAACALPCLADGAPIAVDGQRLSWTIESEHGHQLRLQGPDGEVAVHDFSAGEMVTLERDWNAGQYHYELHVVATADPQRMAAALAARERGESFDGATVPIRFNGGFLVDDDGTILAGTDNEGESADSRSTRD